MQALLAALKSPAAAHRQQQQQRRRRQATMAIELLQPAQKQRPNNKEGKQRGRETESVVGRVRRGRRNMYIRFKINVTARLIMLRLHTAGPSQAKTRPVQAATCPPPPATECALHLRSTANGACCGCDCDCACSTVAALNGLGNQWLPRSPLHSTPPPSRCWCSANMPAS